MREDILRETELARPFCVPELSLYTITANTRLWRATEPELAAIGWPEPFWAFPWAGGQALARYLLDHPALVAGRRVFDFGTGGGLVALAAARAGASEVIANDVDPVAEEAFWLNVAQNVRRPECKLSFDLRDRIGERIDADVLCLGDVCYEGPLSARLAPWLRSLAGLTILIGDPDRRSLPDVPCRSVFEIDVPADIDLSGRSLRPGRVLRV